MQLVRCEQCGAKALIAASQCPRCAHAFFLRNARGETVPLGHCRVCDTYYPRSRGGCRWCGTKASVLPVVLPRVLVGVAAAALVVMLGVWQYRSRTSGGGDEGVSSIVSPTIESGYAATAEGERVPYAPETAPAESVVTASSGQVAVDEPVSYPAPATSAPAPVPAPTPTDPPSPAPRPRPNEAYTGPWTRSVAQSWVNVRAAPSLDAAVVGVVTPNARVELGESQGAWRRVRSAGVQGWADGSFFGADSAGR